MDQPCAGGAGAAVGGVGDGVRVPGGHKRGRRLRWTDAEGRPTTARLIAHDTRPGVICWHEATPEEAAELGEGGKGGRKKRYDDFECMHAVLHRPGESQTFYVDLITGALGCAKATPRRMLLACVKEGWIVERGDSQFRRFEVTAEDKNAAKSRPSACNWVSECQNAT